MKLVVIVNWYPPDRRVPARRWGWLVAELQRLGMACTVIAAGDGSFSTDFGDAGERIIRLPISNKAPTKGAQSRVSTTRTWSTMKGALWYFIPYYIRNRNNHAWRDVLEQRSVVAAAIKDCDVVVASYGPMWPLHFGRCVAAMYRKPLVIDIRDSFQAKEGAAFFFSRWVSRLLERRLLARACARITIGKKLANYLARQYRLSFHAIYNGWSDEDVLPHPYVDWAEAGKANKPYLYYSGTIYQHRLEALSLVFRALKKQDDLRLRIRVLNDNTEKGLNNVVKAHGVTSRVDLLPPVSSTEVAEEAARSRGLLVLENLSPSKLHDGTVTGKLFGLLASGMPGIAISSPSGEIREIVQKISSWYGVSTEMECVQAIRGLPKAVGHSSNLEAISAYHVTAQAKELYDLLQECSTRY